MTPKKRVVPVFIPHLGCPNDCVFCNQRKISGAKQPADTKTVLDAIRASSAVLNGAPAELAFYGGSFTAIAEQQQEELLQAAQEFLHLSSENSLRLSTRPDCVDEKVINRLLRYGVKTVELGVQSMCDDVLLQSGRGHTAQDTVNASQHIKKAGFKLVLQMMTGLPGDTAEKSEYTAQRLIDLSPDGVRIYPAVIIKDTEMYDMWRAGTYREHTVTCAAELCAKLCDMFFKAGIPVIRLGLNPTAELSGGQAVGGAYHPAFGEIVYSKLYLSRAREVLKSIPTCSSVVLGVGRGCMSMMTGQHRCNIETLKREFKIAEIKVRETDMDKWSVGVLRIEKDIN